MNDFLDLEKKCKTLRKKRILKYSGGAVGVVVMSVMAMMFLKTPTTQKTIEKPKKIEKNVTKAVVKKVEKKPEKILPKPKPTVVPPMMEVEFDLNKIDSKNIEKKLNKKHHKTNHKNTNHKKHKVEHKKTIHKKETKNTLINETITFDKALYLAKDAFNKHKYNESIKWCKIASKLNNDSAEIWRLYALNLVRLHKKDKAILVLRTYLKYKQSIKIKHLLKRLEK